MILAPGCDEDVPDDRRYQNLAFKKSARADRHELEDGHALVHAGLRRGRIPDDLCGRIAHFLTGRVS